MAHGPFRLTRSLTLILALPLVSAALATQGGCNRATSKPIAPPPTARQLLDRMVEAYRKAHSYADSGQLRLAYRKQGADLTTQTADESVTFVRPNKLRMHCYQAIVVCDGKQLRATVADLPGQVLDVPAPAELKREDLFTDEILSGVLTQGLAGESIQLALLMLDDPLKPILEGAEEPTLLPARELDGEECQRVEVKRGDGSVVFWIDQKDILRRLDYPTDELKKQISQHEQAHVSEVSLSCEFKGARFNDRIADVAFELAVPEDAKLVKRFQVQPEPMQKLLGQKIAAFEFLDLEGKPVTRDSLSGKVVVIDFWATWCGWCFKGLPNLQQVYDRYKDNDRVAFLTVSTDEVSVSNNDLTAAFDKANLHMPIARDVDQHARTMFDVQGLPTMFILAADGTVESIDVGFQPKLAVELPRKIDRLLAGDSLYQQALREHQARQQAFETSLESGNAGATDTVEIPKAHIAERSEPQQLKLQLLWHSDEATKPGNLLPVEQPGGEARIYVNDGWRTVVALNDKGQLAGQFQLDIPEEAAVSFLRTATDAQGQRYFAGSASAQQQLFVFDGEFRKILSFPEGEHAGISDLRLADMDGNGQVELSVGYWGTVGVQSVTLEGQRRWADRALENVFCLAVTGPSDGGRRGLWAADGRGMIVPIDDDGKDGSPISLNGRFLRWVALADLDGDGQTECCAIASTKIGVEAAVGLSPTGDLLWNYDLPVGAHANAALEMVAAGALGNSGKWVLAGSDGSVHILSASGQLIDQFHTGAAISGLTVATIDGKGALVVATDQGVDAWRITE
ncbi:MAG TPA: redoxin domain-containing protein [Pirellulales bacterium]|nr:redoxin domain-containing protein [Pirellulales bacterium]